MAHSFNELYKAVIHVIILVRFLDCNFHSGGCGIEVIVSFVCSLVSSFENKF